MAKLVNAQEEAYRELDKLKNIHTAVIREIQRELEKTKNLVGEKSGFQIEKTSKKVKALVEAYEEQIFSNLEQAFEISEKSVQSMENMLIEKDKISS